MVFLRRRMDYKGYKCRRGRTGCTDLLPRMDRTGYRRRPGRMGLLPDTDCRSAAVTNLGATQWAE